MLGSKTPGSTESYQINKRMAAASSFKKNFGMTLGDSSMNITPGFQQNSSFQGSSSGFQGDIGKSVNKYVKKFFDKKHLAGFITPKESNINLRNRYGEDVSQISLNSRSPF